jgi:hypothetical protein
MPKKIIDIFPPTPTRNLKEKIFSLPYKNKKFWSGKKKILILFFVFVISILSLIHFVFSKVTIEIWPETQILDFEENITADLDQENTNDLILNKTIPAEILDTGEIIASQSFPASGKISKESKATGKITIYNNYRLSQYLTVDTRFQAPSDSVLYFRSTKAVTVPAKGTLEIDVIADRPGEEYNIDPVTFSIPGLVGLPQYTSIYGKSFSKMEGGFKGEVSKVEKEDLERAKNVLVEKLFGEARESLKIKATNDYILLNDATKEEVLDTSSSVEAGVEAQSFVFQAKVKSQALTFKKSNLEYFAKEFIKSKIREGQKIKEDSLMIDYSPESINLNIGKIVLKLKFSAKVYSDIDIASLRGIINNKSLEEAKIILEKQTQVKQVKISSWPFWIKNIPENDKKTEIKLTIDPPLISP